MNRKEEKSHFRWFIDFASYDVVIEIRTYNLPV